MAANPNRENVFQEYRNATCLVETRDSEGTGFLYGDSGWVMSVAHNFQNERDRRDMHSLLPGASFIFNVDGIQFAFPPPPHPHRRMAFIHHLQAGENVDPNNKDIAMVKLGVQHEHGRHPKDYKEWETLMKEIGYTK